MTPPSKATRSFGMSRQVPMRMRATTPPSSVPDMRRMYGGAQGTPAPILRRDDGEPAAGRSGSASSAPEEPPSIGNYQIVGCLGTGGMAEVYVGVHSVLGHKVAIKVLRRDLVHDGTARRRFLQEARIIDRLRHTNIPDLVDVGQMLDGRLYLVMELLEGQTLAARLEKGRMAPLESVAILSQICAGLETAHALGIYHRDLKPDNIFLATEGGQTVAKILDWGVARVVETVAPRLTGDGLVVGTPLYIAPEQARGLPADCRSDVYALGAVAYEMFLHTPPFTGSNGLEIVYRHIRDVPVMPRILWPDVPPLLESLLLGMLAKVPELRPQLDLICDGLAAIDAELRRRAEDRGEVDDRAPPAPAVERMIDDGANNTDTWIQIQLAPVDDDVDVVLVAPVSEMPYLRARSPGPDRRGELTRVLDELSAEI